MHKISLILVVIIINALSAFTFAETTVSNAASPYISMHASDAIKWHAWDSNAIQKAKKENKPIYLTIGYFSCYWCHVLQRESFNSHKIADIVNKSFIPVVVDRELNPVLDSYLTKFAEETIGRGGWPLNVILTPDGYPFMATIYLPEDKMNVWFHKAQDLWNTDPDYIRTIAQDAAMDMNMQFTLKKEKINSEKTKQIVAQYSAEILSARDEFDGGFGDQAKFPLPSVLSAVLDLYQISKRPELMAFIQTTLDSMIEHNLYDQLEGGFFRYTTDPGWQIPHFEKMLYDNAQLVSLYIKAGKVINEPRYTKIGLDIMDFILAHFQNEDGAFISSFSAVDESGNEGGYYLWKKDETDLILTDQEKKFVNVVWDWQKPAMIEGSYLPGNSIFSKQLGESLGLTKKQYRKLLQNIKSKLLTKRKTRKLPIDKKVITAWNALTLIALIDAYQISGKTTYFNAAKTLVEFISTKLLIDDQLYRALHMGELSGNADLEDYVYTAYAFQNWRTIAKNALHNNVEITLAKKAWRGFFSEKGWAKSDDLLIPYGSRESIIADGPLPSSSSMLIKMSLGSGDKYLVNQAKVAMQLGHNILLTRPFWFGNQVMLLANQK